MNRKSRIASILLAGLIAGLTLFLLLWFVPSGTAASTTCNVPTDPYPTIQSAVDDAACDTIDVAAGTFVENIVISRSLAIHGETMTTTIVDGDAAGGAKEMEIVPSFSTPGLLYQPGVALGQVTKASPWH